MMKYIDNELQAMFDVDETLVMHNIDESYHIKQEFICPYTQEKLMLTPHHQHIQILKQQKARGYYVTVWSAGGAAWAKTVVETLQLEAYVDEVRAKPTKYFDDLPGNEILGTRVYLEYKL